MCPSPSDSSDELSPSPSPSSPPPPPPSPSLLFSSTPPPDPMVLDSPPDLHPSWTTPDEHPSPRLDGDSGSDTPSTAKRSGRVKLRELRTLAREVVKTAGGLASQILTAPGTAERVYGLYLPDQDDVVAIGDPLASLASRRVPEGADNPDVSDLVRLAFGLLMYGVKQRDKAFQLRDVEPPPDLEDGDESGDPDADES